VYGNAFRNLEHGHWNAHAQDFFMHSHIWEFGVSNYLATLEQNLKDQSLFKLGALQTLEGFEKSISNVGSFN